MHQGLCISCHLQSLNNVHQEARVFCQQQCCIPQGMAEFHHVLCQTVEVLYSWLLLSYVSLSLWAVKISDVTYRQVCHIIFRASSISSPWLHVHCVGRHELHNFHFSPKFSQLACQQWPQPCLPLPHIGHIPIIWSSDDCVILFSSTYIFYSFNTLFSLLMGRFSFLVNDCFLSLVASLKAEVLCKTLASYIPMYSVIYFGLC